jgi:hypothetical protein
MSFVDLSRHVAAISETCTDLRCTLARGPVESSAVRVCTMAGAHLSSDIQLIVSADDASQLVLQASFPAVARPGIPLYTHVNIVSETRPDSADILAALLELHLTADAFLACASSTATTPLPIRVVPSLAPFGLLVLGARLIIDVPECAAQGDAVVIRDLRFAGRPVPPAESTGGHGTSDAETHIRVVRGMLAPQEFTIDDSSYLNFNLSTPAFSLKTGTCLCRSGAGQGSDCLITTATQR